jgi:REP element-mobilizing transposase RayT
MWNDTDIPLAIFFTFRCYGTWLHGDERGSVDRHNNVYRTRRIPRNSNWEKFNKGQLLHPPVSLNAAMRKSVEIAIRNLCEKRGWELLAINICTNHGHVVINIFGGYVDQALIAIKARSTHQMRQDQLWIHGHSPWADKGSKRRLWNENSIWEAVNYVLNEQGDDLRNFDRE